MKQHQKSPLYSQAFTLIEVMVALSIAALILLVTTQITMTGLQKIRTITYDQSIHTNISYVVQTIQHEIKNSETITKVSDTELLIRFPNYTTTTLKQDGTAITLGGLPITTNKIRVTYFHMDIVGSSLKLSLSVEAGPHNESSLSVQTTLSQRN